jgi:hypothetical protein
MGRIRYQGKKFSAEHQAVIERADAICSEYAAQGFALTLRQLYYQFVARGLMANRQSEYKRLGGILNDARMAGELDWDYLVDRTRNLVSQPKWDSPHALIRAASQQYLTDLWSPQKHRVEVWIEKDAGIGVIETVCNDNSVPFFSCRGYTSVSEIWEAGQRIGSYLRNGERVTILHIGDHDPSGIDMTRDIDDRLRLFITRDWISDHIVPHNGVLTVGDIKNNMREEMGLEGRTPPWRIKRIALNYDQVEEYQPPPNPAKQTDSRFEKYMEQTGLDESWELDALDPAVLRTLIQDEIDAVRDDERWDEANLAMEKDRAVLREIANNWSDVRAQFAAAAWEDGQ